MRLIRSQGQALLPLFEQGRAALCEPWQLIHILPAGQRLLADEVNKEKIFGDLSKANGVFMSERR